MHGGPGRKLRRFRSVDGAPHDAAAFRPRAARHGDSLKPPSDEQISEAIRRLLTAIQKRERRVSVAGLIRSNLGNAASVWSATGGHPAWILHLTYLADAVGKKLTVADVARKARTVPQILAIHEAPGNSVYTMAVETENGGNSGIDTIMRTLAEKRLIEDRAPTLDGSWMQRIMDARSANGNFLHSTMTPFSASCGMSGIHGNLCSWGVARMGWRDRERFGTFRQEALSRDLLSRSRDLQADLAVPDGVLERLKRKVTREDLYYTWLVNWQTGQASGNGDLAAMQHWNKTEALGLPGCGKTAARHGCRCRCRASCRRHARTPAFVCSAGSPRPRWRCWSPTVAFPLSTTGFPSLISFPKRSMAGRSAPSAPETGSTWIWRRANCRSSGN